MKKILLIIILLTLVSGCAAKKYDAMPSESNPNPKTSGTSGILPFGEKLGYVIEFNVESYFIYIDECEWITMQDKDRIKALGLNEDTDMPGGFYIYNPDVEKEKFLATASTRYFIIGRDEMILVETDAAGFKKRMEEYRVLCNVTALGNIVVVVAEVYVP
ncbi:MAG: hypothetical protein R6W99_00695 [Clostridia bacterium]